jgi:2,3-bisphosphoglycerate-independent phosphoglycerate mutase
LFLDDQDLIFRCNLISLDSERRISDFTSNQISDESALAIIDRLSFADPRVEIYPGQSYRNVLIVRGSGCLAGQIECYEPHTHIGVNVDDIKMRATDERAAELVHDLNAIMRDSIGQIRRINTAHHTGADMIWLWSASCPPRMPSFASRFGARGAIVAGLDFMRGIGRAIGMETREIRGATGYLNTDLKQKLRYARNFLQHNDVVVVHVNAPDEEAHLHRVGSKVQAIERIDCEIVKPLLGFLDEYYPGNYRIAVLPDHYTRLSDGQHTADPVPYLVYGDGIAPDGVDRFDEASVGRAALEVLKSHDFMDMFLHGEW